MDSFFSADFFIGNRQRLLALVTDTAPIVVTAQGLLQRNGDTNFTFRQDSNFWYLTGLNIPNAILVMDQNKEYVIIPDLSPTDEVFGSPHDFEAINRRSGIASIVGGKEGWKQLSHKVNRVKHIATMVASPAYSEHYGFYTNPARAELIERLKSIQPDIELLDLREHLAGMRMVKQPSEILAIRQAIAITTDGMAQVASQLGKYDHEYEIEADLTRTFRYQGALGHAFSPIVASGTNTCHLHYNDNSASLKGAHHLYLDVGAEVENYSADITRTYFLQPPTNRERSVVDAVQDVATYAREQLRPGVSIRDNEKAIEQFMGEKLRELGLIKTINRESVRKYYTHSCSHYLGLDTHDVGDYEAPLVPNIVLTVEPGIYIPEENFGVRIEDDVMVTETGIEVLSRHLPYDLV